MHIFHIYFSVNFFGGTIAYNRHILRRIENFQREIFNDSFIKE